MSDIVEFANRLRKNLRHWDKWARRQGITCYRVYDRDLPEFPVAIDRYGQYVHLQEYATRWETDADTVRRWRRDIVATVAEVFQCPRGNIAVKLRQRQRGTDQYEKLSDQGESFVVTEHGHRFEVNLHNYLDTGLFLDHRNTRRMVEERAAGARFLNLFAYAGAFTVYAAAGGALFTTTVDLSNTYQDWARRNFLLNDMDLSIHTLVRTDVFRFLHDAQRHGSQYDLIVMDPPSFSNSKRMQEVLDIQRDHVRLIDGAMALLDGNGELVFSSNRRGLRLDAEVQDRYAVHEISRQTVPEDFRNKNIHRCWLIRHATEMQGALRAS